jgi:hypothetical protein
LTKEIEIMAQRYIPSAVSWIVFFLRYVCIVRRRKYSDMKEMARHIDKGRGGAVKASGNGGGVR